MIKVYLFICMVFMTSNVFATDISKLLDRTDVTHLQLLANDLNMLTLIQKAKESVDQEKTKKMSEITNTLTRYSVSKDHKLVIESFYQAPVTKVTNNECNELVSKLSKDISGNDSTMTKLLLMLSTIKLNPTQTQQIADDSYLIVYMQAEENKQLSINCRK